MKPRSYALLLTTLAAGSVDAQDIRSATSDNLNLAGAWVDGTAATNTDVATWNASSTLANTLGANLAWAGLNVSGASGAVTISGSNTLAAGAVNLGANNLSITTSTANNSFNLTSLTGTGTFTLSNGTTNLGTTNLNTANALNFSGTLALRGGNATTVPGTAAGSFFYLGRTGISQAASTSFALDTGASTTNAKDVILDGDAWNNKTITLSSLTGFGTLRRDSGSAGTVSINVNQAADTVFSGLVLSHTSTGSIVRHLNFTKNGAGSLTLAGLVGKQTASAGAAAADINLTVSGGTLVLTAANTRTGATSILSGATLQAGNGGSTGLLGGNAVTNDGSLVFNYGSGATVTASHVISGTGTISKQGAGTLILTGSSTSFSGATTVNGGTLRLAGDLGASAMSVAGGATLTVGAVATPGFGFVKSLSLAAGSMSTFRVGSNSDQLVVLDTDGLSAAGPHVIQPVFTGGLNPGDRIPIIEYSGTFPGFSNLSLAPGTRFALVNNTDTSDVELEYTGGTLTWTGGTGAWDLDTTPNWALGGNPTNFLTGDAVMFGDGAGTGSVSLAGSMSPFSVTINNDSLAYTLSGGTIAGTGAFTKQGPGSATVTSATSYTGTTLVDEGTLTFGDGSTNGQIGSGPVSVLTGATLRIHRSDLLDYKTNARLRNVSGGGDIVIDGGNTVFNYTGTGTGFAETNSWAGFSGNLRITNGSEFQTIRNGATAMGSGSLVLGDATTSGKLSQIEGNWTWTNPINVVGPDNQILNRTLPISGGRLMKLQGVISGGGNLTLSDPAAAMTNLQTGFILTGSNTFNGTLTISTGVPVRVGGVPGNADVSQAGADAFGTLGNATLVNNGTLTFSRTDSHTVANSISGSGQVVIGLTSGTTAQAVTFTGTKTYSGTTTVNNGTLVLNTVLSASPVTVNSAGTLSGNGSLGAATTVSGTLSPGSSVGSLNSSAELSLQNGSHYLWEISDWTGSAGSGYDTLQAATLVINSVSATPAVIQITPASLVNFSETAKTFVLATTTGGITGLDAGDITVDAGAFSGAGTWNVQANGNLLELHYTPGSADPFADWAAANGIPGASANDDNDGDGISNGIEFVIGGDPSGPDSDSSALLPTITTDASYLNFVFRRSDASATLDPSVEYSATLVPWTEALGGVDGVIIDEVADGFGSGIDQVTVRIPKALGASGKLFARLRAEIP